MKLMGLLSSLPIQAASATGSIRIATRFADITKLQSVSSKNVSRRSRPSADERESAFAPAADARMKRRRPNAIGGDMAWAGPDIRREPRGNAGQAARTLRIIVSRA